MRKRKAIYALSAFLLLGGVSVVGLTSCGPSEPDGPVTPPIGNTQIDGFTVALSGSNEIVVGETVNVVATSSTSGVDGIFTYDVTEGDAVTKVIYKGEVLLKQGYYFTAYVAVDVNTKLITGYEVIGDVVSSAWTSHAPSFDGWEDKFDGTDGTTVTDTVAGATLTSNAFKDIAKDAVAQAIIDFE